MSNVAVEDREVFVWAALDRETYEVIHDEVSLTFRPRRVVFLRAVFERCRGRPVIVVTRGPWYNWSLDELDVPCDALWVTWGTDPSSNRGSARSSTEPAIPLTGFRTSARIDQLTAGRKLSL